MITRLEVDGFKSLRQFAMDFAPFTVLVGPNSAGKSNVLEALSLLSHLASEPIEAAFKRGRGRAIDQFTVEQGQPGRAVQLAVELLLPGPVETGDGATNRLRYELTIARKRRASGAEALVVEHERLATIGEQQDTWSPPPHAGPGRAVHAPAKELLRQVKRNREDLRYSRRRLREARREFLVTPESHTALAAVSAGLEGYVLSLSVDAVQELHKLAQRHNASAEEMLHALVLVETQRAEDIQSALTKQREGPPPADTGSMGRAPGRRGSVEGPALAVARSLSALRLIHLDSMRLQEQSERIGSATLAPDASNLPTVLAAVGPRALGEIRADLVALVPGVSTFDVVGDRESFRIDFELSGGDRLPARLVSEGTLRALALLTALRSEPPPSMIAIEEPENGIYPGRLRTLLDLLREASCERAPGASPGATEGRAENEDEDAERDDAPTPPQLIVTSHSPVVLTALREEPGCLRFIDTVRRSGRLATGAWSVGAQGSGERGAVVPLGEIDALLSLPSAEAGQ